MGNQSRAAAPAKKAAPAKRAPTKKTALAKRAGAKTAAPAKKTSATTRPGRGAAVPAGLVKAWNGVPQATRDEFERAVSPEPAGTLNPDLWGPEPTIEARRAAALRNLEAQYTARRKVIEESLTRPQAAGILGVSEQAVLDRLDAGDLIGLRQGREWRFPVWQFVADTERGFLPGLAELKRLFADGVVSLSEWVTSENVDLGDATPAQKLATGNVDDVHAVARAVTSAAW